MESITHSHKYIIGCEIFSFFASQIYTHLHIYIFWNITQVIRTKNLSQIGKKLYQFKSRVICYEIFSSVYNLITIDVIIKKLNRETKKKKKTKKKKEVNVCGLNPIDLRLESSGIF